MEYTKTIQIDNVRYAIELTNTFEILFYRTGGWTKKNGQINTIDLWGHEVDQTEIFNDSDNSLKVIRTITKNILKLIHEYKPPYFTFYASEESRAKVYKHIALCFSKNIPYTYCQISEKEKEFLFVKD